MHRIISAVRGNLVAWLALFVALLIALIGLAGCGTNAAEQARKKQAQQRVAEVRTRSAEERTTKERKERLKEASKHKVEEEGQTCSTQVGALIKAEAHMSGDLSGGGLNYKEYSDQLSKVVIAYEEIPVKKLSPNCVNQAVGAEKAMNEYKKADEVWETCMHEPECRNDSIHPKLEEHWSKASKEFERAKEGIEELSKGNVPSRES